MNYTGIPAAAVEVEIAKADPIISSHPTATGSRGQKLSEIRLEGGATNTSGGTFAWAKEVDQPVNGAKYDVIFTPNDKANYNTVTFKVTVNVYSTNSTPDNGPDTPS